MIKALFYSNFFDTILAFLKNYWYFFVLAFALFIFIYILIKLKNRRIRFKKMIKDLEDKYEALNKYDILSKLNRIAIIGNENIAFNELYNSYRVEYDKTSKEVEDFKTNNIDYAKKLLSDGNYRMLSSLIAFANENYPALNEKVINLDFEIYEHIKDDDNLKSKERFVFARILKVKNYLLENTSDFDFIHSDVINLFNNVDNKIELFHEYLLKGNYPSATEILNNIEAVAEYLENNGESIISYSRMVSLDLPTTINELIEEYKYCQSLSLPVYNIPALSIIDSSKKALLSIVNKLRKFHIEGIQELVDSIINKCHDTKELLDNELKAKESYDEQVNSIYYEAEQIERFYVKRIKSQDEINKDFQLDQYRNDTNQTIKQEIQKLNVVRRSLDSLIYGGYPYSKRIERLEELKKQTDLVKGIIFESDKNVDEMKETINNASNIIEEKARLTREWEISLRNTNHEGLIAKYTRDINKIYDYVEQLSKVIDAKPIDVVSANKICNSLNELSDKVFLWIKEDLNGLVKVKEALLSLNLRRDEDASLDKELLKAENYYYDGRIAEALVIINEVKDNLSSGV